MSGSNVSAGIFLYALAIQTAVLVDAVFYYRLGPNSFNRMQRKAYPVSIQIQRVNDVHREIT